MVLVLRDFVVQVGFYEHAVAAAGLCDGGAACVHWNASPVLCLSIVFVTMLSFAIAFCKDVPDIAGDVKGGVRTLHKHKLLLRKLHWRKPLQRAQQQQLLEKLRV